MLSLRGKPRIRGRIEAAPKSAPTLIRGLTHQIDHTDWRAAMDITRRQSGGFRSPERWNTVVVPERVAERAHDRVKVDDEGCWISTYSVGSHGYAQLGWQDAAERHMVLAHRAAWVHVHGQLPMGMTLDHQCKKRRCVRPSHMRLLPNFENARRVNGMDWPMGQCANGHSNIHLAAHPRIGRTGVVCSECRRVYVGRSNWRRRHPGEPMPSHLLLVNEGA